MAECSKIFTGGGEESHAPNKGGLEPWVARHHLNLLVGHLELAALLGSARPHTPTKLSKLESRVLEADHTGSAVGL